MNWTNEKPRVGGRYWWKSPGGIVQILLLEDGVGFGLWASGQGAVCYLEKLSGQWAGPIPEPTDATQPHYVDKAVKTDLNTKL